MKTLLHLLLLALFMGNIISQTNGKGLYLTVAGFTIGNSIQEDEESYNPDCERDVIHQPFDCIVPALTEK